MNTRIMPFVVRTLLVSIFLAWTFAAQATVPTGGVEVTHTCDGVTDEFTFDYKTIKLADLVVTTDVPSTLVAGSDYTVTGIGLASGGVVTLLDPATDCPDGATLTIWRNVDYLQTTSFRTQGSFNPAVHENALDKLAMGLQQVNGRTTTLCEEVNEALSLAQGPMGPQGPAGTNGTDGLDGSISSITQNLDFTNTYKNVNLPAPTAAGDSVNKGYVDPGSDAVGSITWTNGGANNGNTGLFKAGRIVLLTVDASPGTTGGTMTLPVGYRPSTTWRAVMWNSGGTTGYANIATNGVVTISGTTGIFTGSTAFPTP